MMSGLLLIFNYKGMLLLPSAIAGYLAFLLSLSRTAWGGWFIGLLSLVISTKAKLQMRLGITVIVLLLAVIPFTTMDAFSDDISERLGSLSSIEEDGSANTRAYWFSIHVGNALTSWLGEGIGGKIYDWGIFTPLFVLGWLGTIFYLSGVLLLLLRLYIGTEDRSDAFISIARAVAIANFVMLPLGNPTLEVQGVIFWGFLGMGTGS